jgi:hypothetical protein
MTNVLSIQRRTARSATGGMSRACRDDRRDRTGDRQAARPRTVDERRCGYCKEPLARRDRESDRLWERRKYCSRRCAGKDHVAPIDTLYTVDPNGCWRWNGHVGRDGYALCKRDGYYSSAHRVVYTQLRGPIPKDLHLDHLCRVRDCVNPDHLEPVTPYENFRRGLHFQQTPCKRGHEFTEDNTSTASGRVSARPVTTSERLRRHDGCKAGSSALNSVNSMATLDQPRGRDAAVDGPFEGHAAPTLARLDSRLVALEEAVADLRQVIAGSMEYAQARDLEHDPGALDNAAAITRIFAQRTKAA